MVRELQHICVTNLVWVGPMSVRSIGQGGPEASVPRLGQDGKADQKRVMFYTTWHTTLSQGLQRIQDGNWAATAMAMSRLCR